MTLVPPVLAVTDDPGTLAPQPAGSADPASAFLAALRTRLGMVEARVWLSEARMAPTEDGWELLLASAFKADWLRLHQPDALDHARLAAGLAQAPAVLSRPR